MKAVLQYCRRRCKTHLALWLTIWAVFFLFSTAVYSDTAKNVDTSDRSRQILVLNSYHQGFLWTDDIVHAVTKDISAQLNKAEFHIEYMDKKRVISSQMDELIRESLVLKYEKVLPDLIITSDDNAFNFIAKHHQDLFPGVPVVFCGVNNLQAALAADRNFFSGLVETLDIEANIDLAFQLFPGIREVVTVSDGTPTGLGTRQMVMAAEKSYPAVTFTYLNGEELSTEEMLAQLRLLPSTSVVLAPAWYVDKAGTTYDNVDIYPRIAKAAAVPVIGTSSANIGLGILGGKVNSGSIQGEFAAEQAIRILSGKALSGDLPVQVESQNRYIFDYRQMVRFSIDKAQLPAGSEVLYQPFSFYQTYRNLVWAVVGLFCLFAVLIVLLLFSIRRLRQIRGNLARSEENLRVTLLSIGDAVITTDTHGCVRQMNKVAEVLTGWQLKEAQGKPLAEVFEIVNAVSRVRCPDPVHAVLASGGTVNLAQDTLLLSKDSCQYRIADSCATIMNDDGEAIGAVLVFRDITKEYLREQQLQQSRKLEAVGQLAGGVAHDFNNMLVGIIGSAELLAMKLDKKPELQPYLDTIIKAGSNAASLIQKLLLFSRKGTFIATPMDIHDSITNVLSLLRHSLDRNIVINKELGADVTIISGDSGQIENTLINLAVNGGQAMPDGGTLTISTDNIELDAIYCESSPFDLTPGLYVQVSIRDSGGGIPADLLGHIFEPFFTTKEVGKGTGLGLSAVYGTVVEHRGCITVYSEIGEGTVFHIYLPVANHAETVIVGIDDEAPRGNGCILIIDDEEFVRRIACSILENLGYTCILARDGVEGVEIFAGEIGRIDLVLLDMVMPRMGGMKCLREIRSRDAAVKILISSGFTQEGLTDLQLEGISGFVKKPFRRIELARAVNRALTGGK